MLLISLISILIDWVKSSFYDSKLICDDQVKKILGLVSNTSQGVYIYIYKVCLNSNSDLNVSDHLT